MEQTIQLHEIDEKRWYPVCTEMTERRGWSIMVITVVIFGHRRAFLAADAGDPEMQGVIARYNLSPVFFLGKDLAGLRNIIDSPGSNRVFDSVDDVGFDCTTDMIKNEIRAGHVDKALALMASPPAIDWISLTYMSAFSVEVHSSGTVTIRDKNPEIDALPNKDRFDSMMKEVLGHVVKHARGTRRLHHVTGTG
jgi:hypothetical protein